MKRNIIIIGERTLEGKYGRVLCAGETRILNSGIKKIRVAGEMNVGHSYIGKTSIAGELNATKSDFSTVRLIGEANLHDACTIQTLSICGDLSADSLKADQIYHNDAAGAQSRPHRSRWHGAIQTEALYNKADLTLECDLQLRTLVSFAPLYSNHDIECTKFFFFSSLEVPSVNAEEITLLANENHSIQTLFGSRIQICTQYKISPELKSAARVDRDHLIWENDSMLALDSIEGDDITIEHTNAHFVAGDRVTIGDLCVIDRVEYRSNIHISEKSVVGEVVKI